MDFLYYTYTRSWLRGGGHVVGRVASRCLRGWGMVSRGNMHRLLLLLLLRWWRGSLLLLLHVMRPTHGTGWRHRTAALWRRTGHVHALHAYSGNLMTMNFSDFKYLCQPNALSCRRFVQSARRTDESSRDTDTRTRYGSRTCTRNRLFLTPKKERQRRSGKFNLVVNSYNRGDCMKTS